MTSYPTKKQWCDLLDRVSPKLGIYRPSWYESWLIAFEDQGNWKGGITNFTCQAEGRLRAVFPACTQKFGPLNFISLAGNYFPLRSFPSVDITPEMARQLLKQFSSRSFIGGVRMGPVSSVDSNIMSLVAFFKQSDWKVLSREIGKDFVLTTDADWFTYEGNISARRKQKLRYYWNKLSKTGDTSLIHDNNLICSEWKEVFIALANVEKKSWIVDKGEFRFSGTRNSIFWNSLIQDEWFRRSIKIWRIVRNEETISFVLTFDAGTQRFVFANSYIKSVADFSTGSELYYHMIKDAFESEINEIRFGLGDSGYKSMWNAQPICKIKDFIFLPPTLIGKCSLTLVRHKGFDLV